VELSGLEVAFHALLADLHSKWAVLDNAQNQGI